MPDAGNATMEERARALICDGRILETPLSRDALSGLVLEFSGLSVGTNIKSGSARARILFDVKRAAAHDGDNGELKLVELEARIKNTADALKRCVEFYTSTRI